MVQDKAGKTQMVTKGAVEEMLSICAYAEQDGRVEPLTDALRSKILHTVDELNDKGFRVLAIAQKSNPSPVDAFGVKDERDMVLLGYLAFLDPPKESTADAIRALKDHGVTTKILTGDNDKVTRTICKQVGLKVRNMLLGSDRITCPMQSWHGQQRAPMCLPSSRPTRRRGWCPSYGKTAIPWALWGTVSTMPPP